jgi:hypothetical protein
MMRRATVSHHLLAYSGSMYFLLVVRMITPTIMMGPVMAPSALPAIVSAMKFGAAAEKREAAR